MPPARVPTTRRVARGAIIVCLAAAVLPFAACRARTPILDDDTPYDGPDLRLEAADGRWLLVLDADTAGWRLHQHDARPGFRQRSAIVSVLRPDPAFHHPTIDAEQRLDLGIASDLDVLVYARLAPHHDTRAAGTYALAITAAASPGADEATDAGAEDATADGAALR